MMQFEPTSEKSVFSVLGLKNGPVARSVGTSTKQKCKNTKDLEWAISKNVEFRFAKDDFDSKTGDEKT